MSYESKRLYYYYSRQLQDRTCALLQTSQIVAILFDENRETMLRRYHHQLFYSVVLMDLHDKKFLDKLILKGIRVVSIPANNSGQDDLYLRLNQDDFSLKDIPLKKCYECALVTLCNDDIESSCINTDVLCSILYESLQLSWNRHIRIGCDYYCSVFSDKKQITSDNRSCIKESPEVFAVLPSGIGDFFIIAPLLYAAIYETCRPISYIVLNKTIFNICIRIFPDHISRFHYRNLELLHYPLYTNSNLQNQMPLIFLIDKNNPNPDRWSVYEFYNFTFYNLKLLKRNDPCLYLHQFQVFLYSKIMPIVRPHRIRVAIQRLSGHRLDNFCVREWDIEQTREFLTLCRHNDIETINLEPAEPFKSEYALDYSAGGIWWITQFLSNVDMFIGIDSCMGHICSAVRIPSITLFTGNGTNHLYNNSNYMPLSHNISVFRKGNNSVIKGEYVFHLMMDILNGKRPLSKTFIHKVNRRENQEYQLV